MSQGTPTRRWRKWLLWPLLILLAIIVFAAALLMTGLPQRTLLTRVLGDALNANVEIKGLSLLSDINIGELKAFDKNADASSPPMLDVSGVQKTKAMYYDYPEALEFAAKVVKVFEGGKLALDSHSVLVFVVVVIEIPAGNDAQRQNDENQEESNGVLRLPRFVWRGTMAASA
jgi:hypothetical protein